MRQPTGRLLPPVSSLAAVLAPFAAMANAPAQIPARAIPLSTQYQLNEPRVVQHDDVVNLFATTVGGTAPQLFQWRSDDGGTTWQTQQRALTSFGVPTVLGNVVESSGQLLVLIGHPTSGPMLLRSADDGATWAPAIPIAASFVLQGAPVFTDMFVDGRVIVVAWRNDKANGRVFANRSSDGGLTWQPNDTQLDVGSVTPSGTAVSGVRCIGNGGVVHVMWNGAVGGGTATMHQRTLDGGLTWRATPVLAAMLDTRAAVSDGPSIVILTSSQFRRSADFGDTWSPLTIPGVVSGFDLASSGSLFVATGFSSTFGVDYGVNVSTDGGQTWQVHPLQTTGVFWLEPHLHIGANRIWVHFRWLATFIGALVSSDAGTNWQVVGGPVDAGFHASERRTIHLCRAPGPLGTFFVYVGTGGSSLGTATAGTGGIAPSLINQGLPLQGQSTVLRVERAVGGSLGGLGISFAAPAPLPLGSAIVWPTTAAILLPLTTTGPAGAAGAGRFGLPIVVPIAPALVDTSFTAQALILDGGAADGLTVTNALTVWLR